MNPIETRQLRYFLAVAETLHVGRAALRLHMSQPPLTRQIKALERRVGTALFDRSGRRMTLTDAGTAFRAEAERVLAALERAVRHANEVGHGDRGTVRIGFVSTALYGPLPGLVRDFRATHPDVEIDLLELTADAQLVALGRGDIDLGLALCAEPSEHIEIRTLYREPLVACLPEQHALARRHRSRLAVESLRAEPFVMFPRHLSPGLHDRIVGLAEQAGFALRIEQQAVQMQTIVGLVSAGVGLAIVPDCMRALARPGVVYRRLPRDVPQVETALIAPRRGARPAARAFVRFAKSD